MKHTQSHSSIFSDFPARLAYFSAEIGGTDLPKNTPTAEVRTEAVPAPVNFEEKTMEENEMRAEHENEENQERSEQLPIIEKKFETSDTPTNQKESQKAKVDTFYSEAIKTLEPPMNDVVKASIQTLTDDQKLLILKYNTTMKETVFISTGEKFTEDPGDFGRALSNTLRFSVFADRKQIDAILNGLDPNFRDLLENLSSKIDDKMGPDLELAEGAEKIMVESAKAYAEANPDKIQGIKQSVAEQLTGMQNALQDSGFKNFVSGIRSNVSKNDAATLAAEKETEVAATPEKGAPAGTEAAPKKIKEKGIETEARKLQKKMQSIDADVTVKGSAEQKGNDKTFSVSFDKMDQGTQAATLKEANRQFEGTELVDMKGSKEKLTVTGTEALEFVNFLKRMNSLKWEKTDSKVAQK